MGLPPCRSRATGLLPFASFSISSIINCPSLIFRAKGILWFDESPKRHIFHLSGKRFSLDDDEWKGEPKNQLVLIGQNLNHDN
jgi:G3E family GTPase